MSDNSSQSSFEQSGLSINGQQQMDPSASQRSHDRHTWGKNLQISWLVNESPTPPVVLRSMNLSRGGLALISRGMVHQGTQGVVLLDKGNGEGILRCIEVVHCRYQGRLKHILGMKWCPLPPNLPLKVELTDQGLKLVIASSEFDL